MRLKNVVRTLAFTLSDMRPLENFERRRKQDDLCFKGILLVNELRIED